MHLNGEAGEGLYEFAGDAPDPWAWVVETATGLFPHRPGSAQLATTSGL